MQGQGKHFQQFKPVLNDRSRNDATLGNFDVCLDEYNMFYSNSKEFRDMIIKKGKKNLHFRSAFD